MFKKLFLEILKRPAPLRNVLRKRHMQGSTGSTGRKNMNLLAKSNRTDPNYPAKLKRLKQLEVGGPFVLTELEVQTIKDLFKITDLEERGSRNLGNTGITMYITDNKYFIIKK